MGMYERASPGIVESVAPGPYPPRMVRSGTANTQQGV